MFDTRVLAANLPLLLEGAGNTLLLSVAAFLIGIALGAAACLAGMQSLYTIRWLSRAYIDFFRTIPELVPLIWLYACAPFVFSVDISPVTVGLIVFSLIAGAALAEIFRMGLQAIPNGQRDAANALGLTRLQTFRKVLLPQIVFTILPPSINLFSDIVKASSVLSLIGVTELAYYTAVISASTYEYLEMYTAAGAIYFVMISAIRLIAGTVGRRFARYRKVAGR